MTDRELLELAAKAAGLKGWKFYEEHPVDGYPRHSFGMRLGGNRWNPLTDDGDALRLAAKLFLWQAVRDGYQHVDSDNDIYAATRRAIVRAAAEIGRAA
jgi:hypothetical protein